MYALLHARADVDDTAVFEDLLRQATQELVGVPRRGAVGVEPKVAAADEGERPGADLRERADFPAEGVAGAAEVSLCLWQPDFASGVVGGGWVWRPPAANLLG